MNGRLGKQQVAILRTVHSSRWFDCAGRNNLYRVCLRLHYRGLLKRDPVSRDRFTSTPNGELLIEMHDAALGPVGAGE